MHVFTIPPSVPFLRTLVTALVDGRLVDGFAARKNPEALAGATLYLPTQRAVREVRKVFLDVLARDAAILPRIVALGDIDEDELIFADAAAGAEDSLRVPPAIGGMARRLLLAQLIAQWAQQKAIRGGGEHALLVVGGPASSLLLADELARLMDDMTTRGVSWEALKGLVPDDLDVYWQLSLDFLKIATEAWPHHLADNGLIEPAQRRDLLIASEAKRLATQAGPVIAAGSTGSMPATARFLEAVAKLPHGAVVLPGLDTELDEVSWNLIGGDEDDPSAPSHPQFAMFGLLKQFGIKRGDVEELKHPDFHSAHSREGGNPEAGEEASVALAKTGSPPPRGRAEERSGREVLTSEAMRPSAATAAWSERLAQPAVSECIAQAMDGISVLEAPGAEMEALAIAAAMREAREQNFSAALVTPDRALARRVQMALGRWNLAAEDSRGDGLLALPAGLFARMAAAVIAEQLAPAPLLALLKHPLFRLGRHADGWHDAIATLELALLRGSRPAAGSKGLGSALAGFRAELEKLKARQTSTIHPLDPRAKVRLGALDEVEALVGALGVALTPLEQIERHTSLDFKDAVQRHSEVIAALSAEPMGRVAAFEDDDGEALADTFEALLASDGPSGLVTPLTEYPELFDVAFRDQIVRSRQILTSALRIYGPLELRLTEADRVIIGGLTEGVWPPEPRNDPWLSRPMRRALGLDLPERRIGLAAHDFVQLLGAREVIVSHAAKVAGSPTVPSRFLHRLQAVAGDAHWRRALIKGQRYLQMADALDHSEAWKPIAQPAPKPPRAARPSRLSVTEIEDLLRDPYTIYARHVLNLQPLDPVDMPLSAADRGTAIHNALGDFTQSYPDKLPDNIGALLRELGNKHFAHLMDRPEAQALWWPRFLRIAGWFALWEQQRRPDIVNIRAETRGTLQIELDDKRVFTLAARADRIERKSDGTFAILDYKTGAPPSPKQVSLGLSPQMTLEGAILQAGGFENIPAGASISEMVYVRLSGNEPPGEASVLKLSRGARRNAPLTPDEAAIETRQKLEELIRKFELESQGYTSLNLPMWTNRYGTYDNLSRIKEWSALGGTGEEDIFN